MGKSINEGKDRKVLELIAEGLYYSKIARFIGVSRQALKKRIMRLEQAGFIRKLPGKPVFFELTERGKEFYVPPTATRQPYSMYGLNNATPLHSAHKIKISVEYQGNQPLAGASFIKPFGRYRTQKQAYYRYKGLTIITFKRKLNVWVHKPKGIRTESQLFEARKTAFRAILAFAKDYDLAITTQPARVIQSHHVVEDQGANAVIAPTIQKYEQDIYAQIGTKVCQTSHKGKVEHEGRGRADRIVQGSQIAKGLEYLCLDFPDHFGKVAQQQNRYDENIRAHLSAITEMRDTMKDIRDGLKAFKKLAKQR